MNAASVASPLLPMIVVSLEKGLEYPGFLLVAVVFGAPLLWLAIWWGSAALIVVLESALLTIRIAGAVALSAVRAVLRTG